MIDWKLIADMPEDRKDGRRVLLWDEGGQSPLGREVLSDDGDPIVARWQGRWEIDYKHLRADVILPINPTHYADINPPEGI